MKVITNSGPLMALGKLGLIYLLPQLYDSILIPTAVYEEVVIHGVSLGQPDAYVVQLAITRQELVIVTMNDTSLSETVLKLPLGRGEKHVIELGLRESADWVLIDDLLAREEAKRLGLKIRGTLGIIIQARREGLISLRESELVLQAILLRDDIWINEVLVQRALNELRNV